MTRLRGLLVVLGIFAACAPAGESGQKQKIIVLTENPQLVQGNPTCADFGYSYEYKIDPGTSGSYKDTGKSEEQFIVDIDTDGGRVITWSSSVAVDLVIVKGSDAALVYAYDPEATSGGNIYTPINASGGPAGVSHVDFCWDYEVKVTKTADTALKRTYGWTIGKAADASTLTLATGQIYPMGYTVVVSSTGSVDSDWTVHGTITIENPAYDAAATVTNVTDTMTGGITAAVNCGTLPATIPAKGSITCTYGPQALADGSARTNTAKVETTGVVGQGEGSAAVTFDPPTTVVGVDACVDVRDSVYGDLGVVCIGDAPKTFTYVSNIGPYELCGPRDFVNTALFVAQTTGATGSATATVSVDVPCVVGCTLTPGYWKTHSSYGPAPYDDTWAMIPGGADATFFLSGQSYLQVLRTPPAGNVYYILAHAYIAAELNQLNGASFGAASTAFGQATTLLQTATPAATMGVKGPTRNAFTSLGATLDSYNNGLIGPGHCSE